MTRSPVNRHGGVMGVEARIKRLEDLHEIAEFRACYCQYLDDRTLRRVGRPLHRGRLVRRPVHRHRARSAPNLLFPGLQEGPLKAWWHFSSNETIDLDGDHATGETWLDQPCVVDDQPHIAAGRYADRMRRCADGRWRFEERKITFFLWSPAESGWAPGRFDYPPAAEATDARTIDEPREHGAVRGSRRNFARN